VTARYFQLPAFAGELTNESRQGRGLSPLQRYEADTRDGGEDEIHQQVLERKNILRERLRDAYLLDPAHIAHLPVALRALGMNVVTAYASAFHDDWRDDTHALREGSPRRLRPPPSSVCTQTLERVFLEGVECVRGALRERKVRDEPISHVALLLAYDAAELERESRGNWNRTRYGFVVVRDTRGARSGQHPRDDVRAVVLPDARHQRVNVMRLPQETRLCDIA
jgi:hypothetical protein